MKLEPFYANIGIVVTTILTLVLVGAVVVNWPIGDSVITAAILIGAFLLMIALIVIECLDRGVLRKGSMAYSAEVAEKYPKETVREILKTYRKRGDNIRAAAEMLKKRRRAYKRYNTLNIKKKLSKGEEQELSRLSFKYWELTYKYANLLETLVVVDDDLLHDSLFELIVLTGLYSGMNKEEVHQHRFESLEDDE